MIVFKQYDILLFVLILIAVLAITTYLLEWFRPKEGIYHTLRAVVVIGMVFLTGCFVVTFSNEIMRVEAREVPLYYEDIGGEAGAIIEERIDGTSSIFGSTMRCSIQYADEYVYYEVYQSEYAWVLDAVWEDEMDNKNVQNAEHVTEFWGADEAVHTAGGSYLVKYPDAVLILHFPTDTVLSPKSVEIIQAALLESR